MSLNFIYISSLSLARVSTSNFISSTIVSMSRVTIRWMNPRWEGMVETVVRSRVKTPGDLRDGMIVQVAYKSCRYKATVLGTGATPQKRTPHQRPSSPELYIGQTPPSPELRVGYHWVSQESAYDSMQSLHSSPMSSPSGHQSRPCRHLQLAQLPLLSSQCRRSPHRPPVPSRPCPCPSSHDHSPPPVPSRLQLTQLPLLSSHCRRSPRRRTTTVSHRSRVSHVVVCPASATDRPVARHTVPHRSRVSHVVVCSASAADRPDEHG